MQKTWLDSLHDEGYDVTTTAEMQSELTTLHNMNTNIWEGVKHGRSHPKVGTIAGLCDVIDYCIDRLSEEIHQ